MKIPHINYGKISSPEPSTLLPEPDGNNSSPSSEPEPTSESGNKAYSEPSEGISST